MMKLHKILRWGAMAASGALLFQTTGCSLTPALQVVDTIFLGIAAWASYLIIQNI
jgi:hypothetical protein